MLFTRVARVELKQSGTAAAAELPLRVVIPAFVTSELKTAFQIGFMVFIPFMIIDMVVASVLMSMGMMMLSPVLVSLPFKLMLFRARRRLESADRFAGGELLDLKRNPVTPQSVVTIGQQALTVMLLLAAPLLLTSLVVGLIVSVLQAATQINEMTLTFIPKLVSTLVALVVAGRGW